jgi:hypothetical protein
MSDWTGRRLVLGIADIIFVGGALGQAVCHTVWSMVSLLPYALSLLRLPYTDYRLELC